MENEELMETEIKIESRSKYQKEYRKNNGLIQFNTSIPAELFIKLDTKLGRLGISKKEWLCKQIQEYVTKK